MQNDASTSPLYRIPHEQVANRMLYHLKMAGGRPVNLRELIEVGGVSHSDGHTPFNLVYDMAAERVVRIFRRTRFGKKVIFDQDPNKLRWQVLRERNRIISSFVFGWKETWEAEREREHYVELTEHFLRVQALLGIRTRDLAQREEATISVTPVFGAAHDARYAVFVAMPFAESIRDVYDHSIVPACAAANLTVGRADEIFGANHVMRDVWSLLLNCNKVIVDCTGRNPNVFYELGIAHTIGKPVMLISQNLDDIPFDLRHWRVTIYSSAGDGFQSLMTEVSKFLASPNSTQRPLETSASKGQRSEG